MGNKIDGTAIAQGIKEEIREEIEQLINEGKRQPHLVVIMVGDDPRSAAYVRNKEKSCQNVNIDFTLNHLSADVGEEELLKIIKGYNEDDTVDGIVVQLPLPAGYNESVITEAVAADKDVDGLTEASIIKLYNNKASLVPATPLGIMKILEKLNIDVDGKQVVIVGRGKLVGHPLSLMMLNSNATVTVCHSHTRNLTEITQTADILVVGIGKMNYITRDFVREGAVVIDAGINVDENGRLHGDCDYENMLDKVSWITPVPRGVGPMTVAMLLVNTMTAYRGHEG